MTPTWHQRGSLGLAGVTAAAIGLAITFAPHAFYASYDVSLAADPNLLSEVRAPGTNLAALGLLMLAGAVRSEWFSTASLVAITVFFAFAFGRLVSWALDGPPNAGIQIALGLEFVIGVLVLLTSRRAGLFRRARPSA